VSRKRVPVGPDDRENLEHITTDRHFNLPGGMCYRFWPMPDLAPNVLLSAEQVQARITALAREISDAYPKDEDLHLVAILKGAFLFLGDLIRAMDRHVTVDFMAVSSYAKGTTSSGEVRMIKDLDSGLEGRNVIIVEDIVDTGLTLSYLQEILRARNPKTLRTACLLSKPSRRKIDVKVEYIGFTIEDRFVVGYGLDFAEKYRNLPFIGVLNV
jgi:hypoxanthine phosphoribosyltransferase